MGFAYTIQKTTSSAGGRIACGTYTNTSSATGGDIYTGLNNVYAVFLQPKGSSILANQPVVNETLPLEGKTSIDATIVTTADEVGTFIAIGL